MDCEDDGFPGLLLPYLALNRLGLVAPRVPFNSSSKGVLCFDALRVRREHMYRREFARQSDGNIGKVVEYYIGLTSVVNQYS